MGEFAAAILRKYPIEVLRDAHRRFAWPVRRRSGMTCPTAAEHEAAVEKRKNVGAELQCAIQTGCSERLATALREVHKWGLPGEPPKCLNDASILPVLEAAAAKKPWLQAKAIEPLLNLKGVGIAAVSKWIGLANENCYAIYDSRVSVALRDIAGEHGRYCAVVARRATKTRKPWPADHIQANDMAKVYLRYCEALRDIHGVYKDMPPARTEMALFVLGDVACPDPQHWKACRGDGVWQGAKE